MSKNVDEAEVLETSNFIVLVIKFEALLASEIYDFYIDFLDFSSVGN